MIERIHSKKINNKKKELNTVEQRNFNRSDSKKDDKSTERRVVLKTVMSEKKSPQEEEAIDEIGIQADDEDNDQIETERAHKPDPYGLYLIKEEGGIAEVISSAVLSDSGVSVHP